MYVKEFMKFYYSRLTTGIHYPVRLTGEWLLNAQVAFNVTALNIYAYPNTSGTPIATIPISSVSVKNYRLSSSALSVGSAYNVVPVVGGAPQTGSVFQVISF